jgi:O-antigen/teichoic acid export membrane protein
MQWVYSNKFSGGGILLSILLVAHGFWAIQAILGFILIAAGQVRKGAAVMGLSLLPALPIFVIFVHYLGSVGAAMANVIIPFITILIFGMLLRQRFGMFLHGRSMSNIGLAGMLMFLTAILLLREEVHLILLYIVSLGMYAVVLILSGEISQKDFAAFLFWQKGKQK